MFAQANDEEDRGRREEQAQRMASPNGKMEVAFSENSDNVENPKEIYYSPRKPLLGVGRSAVWRGDLSGPSPPSDGNISLSFA